MEQNRRKKLRLENFDYSSNGAYFVTVCTHEKRELFGCIGVPSEAADKIGEVFEETLARYAWVQCPQYVVMPDHFHALIILEKPEDAPGRTIAELMREFKSKSMVAYIRLVKEGKADPFNGKLWQRSYYDHIVRNERDFLEIWKYIAENPLRWQLKRQKTL